jgi:hypothetical protein
MTRRFLPVWLLMALMATSAMLPTAANAQSVSRQDRARQDGNAQRLVSDRAYVNSNGYANTNGSATSNRWDGNRVQAYHQPPQVFRRFSQQRTRQHGAYRRPWHDDRRW